jgi:Ca-activated chloride channel family protein
MTWPDVRLDVPWQIAAVIVLVVPVLVLMAVSRARRQRSARLARCASAPTLPRLGGAPGSRRGQLLRLTGVALLSAIALTGPRWGMLSSQETRRGIDVVVALDASLSMIAEDERPSRLDRMKQEVRRLRASQRADRMALIAFAGRSYILTPLTADDGALELYLENLNPDVVGQAGSSIARAIRQGTELLGASTGTSDRALVIMSDGEAFEPVEDVRAAATEAAQQGIVLVTVGFGTLEGATIPEVVGANIREKRDEQGQIVVTKYVPELLQAAAEASGGVFVPAEVTDRAGRVRAALSTLRTERRAVSSREDHVSRFTWFLAPALLLLLLDTWLMQRPARRRRSVPSSSASSSAATVPSGTAGGAVLGVVSALVLLLGACAREPDPARRLEAGDALGAAQAYANMIARGDTSYTTRYNLATALLAADSLGAANELFEQVRRGADGEVRARARYNEGLSHLTQGRASDGDTANAAFAKARELFRAYLSERHVDEDGKWNYELALRPQPPMGGGGGGGDNDEQNAEQPESQPQSGQLDEAQAEALLNSAAREERDVQGRQQKMVRRPPPPGGRDW